MLGEGDVVGGRYRLGSVAGAGGLGRVHRAIDVETGEVVAVKLLHVDDPDPRFVREARVLAELRDDAIVRYITHGRTDAGLLFLAMEWVEGESLRSHLLHGRLGLDDSIAVARRVAAALGAAHIQRVVHRDVKPSNVLLPGGDLRRAKLADFGAARVGRASQALTLPGVAIGTPGFMAPEQLRAADRVDARADVFSLGCVLYLCLTGRRPFEGQDLLSAAAQILLDEPPPLRELWPEVPPALDALVTDMLAKDPNQRPRDGSAVLQRLEALGSLAMSGAAVAPIAARLSAEEQRWRWVVLADAGFALADAEAETAPAAASAAPPRAAARAAGRRWGARVELLASGAVLAVLGDGETPGATAAAATDLAARAAACALALREVLPDAPLAVAAGRAGGTESRVAGESVGRAMSLIASSARGPGAPVRLDEVTAGLLDERFDVRKDALGFALYGREASGERVRAVMAHKPAFVGRERELAMLLAAWGSCAAESSAQAVVVTGEAGVGKSRLAREMLERIAAHDPTPEVWIARAEPMAAGSPLALIADLVRDAAGLGGGEPDVVRHAALRARLAKGLEGEALRLAADFLGEILGASPAQGAGDELAASRRDPRLMNDRMRSAWEALLELASSEHPVVLVLEDLHWGDLATVEFVDAALRRLARRPVFVLALGRPELDDLFPRLWLARGATHVGLAGLSPSAAARFVRSVLGDAADARVVGGILEAGAGNAFFLEELVRAESEGRGGAAPGTLLAMLDSRLSALGRTERLALRAASVLGETFWLGAVARLLGVADARDLGETMAQLVDRDLVQARPRSRFPGDEELAFQHALVREAAYGLLTAEDRSLAHRLAGEWLEASGENDAVLLAEHYERGQAGERAATWFARASDHALDGNAVAESLEWAERGLACAPPDSTQIGHLRLAEARALAIKGEQIRVREAGAIALELLAPGSTSWFAAGGEVALAASRLGDSPTLVRVAERMLSVFDQQRAAGEREGALDGRAVSSMALVATALSLSGLHETAELALARIDALPGPLDPGAAAEVARLRAERAFAHGDIAAYLRHLEQACDLSRAIGDERLAVKFRVHIGYAHMLLGSPRLAVQVLEEALVDSRRHAFDHEAAVALNNLGLALALASEVARGEAIEREAVEVSLAQGNRRLSAASRLYLAMIQRRAGRLEEADQEAAAAAVELAPIPPLECLAHAARAEILLERGLTAGALASAERAMELLFEIGRIAEGESLVRLCWAEALHRCGRAAEAIRAATEAKDSLLDRAGRITDPDARGRFLSEVEENARTLAFARTLGIT